MKGGTLVIGSRGSRLALWQAEWVKQRLEERREGLTISVDIIKTSGDKILDAPLSKIGDKGLFTKEIEHALLRSSIDLAVHSLKDLPTTLPDGLAIGAITKREDVRDVFIAHPRKPYRRLDDVPKGGTIATGSLRRTCQLRSWRPDLVITDLRGNLNTRLEKLDASDWDGVVLARAGIVRLGFGDRITEVLPVERVLPAVGQGALAVELRASDRRTRDLVAPLAHELTTTAVLAERALLRTLEGGCQIPIGAYGRIVDNELVLTAMIGSLDGKKIVRGSVHGPLEEPEALGRRLADSLAEGGGRDILDSIRRTEPANLPVS